MDNDNYSVSDMSNVSNVSNNWVNIVEKEVDYDKNIKLFVNSSFIHTDIFCQNVDSDKSTNIEKKLTPIQTINPMNDTNKLPDVAEIKNDVIDMMNKHDTISDIIMLEKTSSYTKKIKHQFNKKIDKCDDSFIGWFTESLELLRDAMFELANRNSQAINLLVQEKKTQEKKVSITRNSYKFCEYGYGCKFNYEKKQKCHAHHYVFNLVYLDIIDILEYISTTFSNDTLDINEIKTSVNTITYVLNHMHDELSQLKTMRPDCYQNYVNRKYDFNYVLSKRPFKKK